MPVFLLACPNRIMARRISAVIVNSIVAILSRAKDGAAVLSANAAYETANRCLQRGGLSFVLIAAFGFHLVFLTAGCYYVAMFRFYSSIALSVSINATSVML